MLISLDWLNAHLDRPVTAEQAEDVLTRVGFPIEQTQAVEASSDTMLDVEVTSNRSDVLSHVGTAREVAAATGCGLVVPDVTAHPAGELDTAGGVSGEGPVETRDLRACSLFTAATIRGVRVGPSPDWLVRRLEAVGSRSINNVVDVTNYVMLELGQPLHAYDMAKLAGRRLIARPAEKGEPLTTLDGKAHELPEGLLVIADAERPQGLAGVMGGLDSEVTDTTVDLLLEAAWFHPLAVRRSARTLKIATDAGYRFERTVDTHGVLRASRRTIDLILETAGGTLDGPIVQVGSALLAPPVIDYRPARCDALLGYAIPHDEQQQRLEALGIAVDSAGGASWRVTPPTFRHDLKREVDLIEEVARSRGLDAVPVQESIELVARPPATLVEAKRALVDVLIAHGYHESVTHSLVAADRAQAAGVEASELASLFDDSSRADATLRPSLLPSLLTCRKANQDAGTEDVRLFETASVWRSAGTEGGIIETSQIGLIVDAEAKDVESSLRELRGVIDEAVTVLGGVEAASQVAVAGVQTPGYAVAAEVSIGGARVGRLGVLTTKTAKAFGLRGTFAAGEFDLAPLLAMYPPDLRARPLPSFPAVERDVSVVVDEATAWSAIDAVLADDPPARLEAVSYLGVFRGEPVPAGRKSVTLRLVFRDPSATLRREQVEPEVEALVAKLTAQLGAELRV